MRNSKWVRQVIALVVGLMSVSGAPLFAETIGIFFDSSISQHQFAARDIQRAAESKGDEVELLELTTLSTSYENQKVVIALASDPGDIMKFTAAGSSDPDHNALRFVWWNNPKAGRKPYGKALVIENASATQWRWIELSFTASKTYENPLSDMDFKATFTGPQGERLDIPGFWDGNKSWKIRFTPTSPGEWTYITKTSPLDNGLEGKIGKLQVAPADLKSENPIFRHGGFVKVSQNKRYLTYSDGTPFFWLSDTWWKGVSEKMPFHGSPNPEITNSTIKYMVDLRKKQGFNAMGLDFGAWGSNVFFNYVKNDTIDLKYIQEEIDSTLFYIIDAGILPAVCLLWGGEITTLPHWERWYEIHRYFIARYGALSVAWTTVGEFNKHVGELNQHGNPEEAMRISMLIGQYIKDNDPYKRAQTIHPWAWFLFAPTTHYDEPWMDYIWIQGAHRNQQGPPPSFYYALYNRTPTKPFMEAELNYEKIFSNRDDQVVRYGAYKAVQCGSLGFQYGANGIWQMVSNPAGADSARWGPARPWYEAAELPGGAQMKHLRNVYEALEWWKLVPLPDAVETQEILDINHNQLILAKGEDNNVFVIYFSSGINKNNQVWLNNIPERLGLSYKGYWINPIDGSRTDLPSLISENQGRIPLPARENTSDWVLVLIEQNHTINR